MLYFTFNNISQKNSLLVQENIEVSDVLDAFNNKLKMELGIGFTANFISIFRLST